MNIFNREYNAYLIPSAVANGLAMHEVFTACIMLYSIPAKQTALWKTSFVTIIIVMFSLLFNLTALDYLSSPYETGAGFMGWVYVSAYVANLFATTLITGLFLMRIRIFYGLDSTFFKGMLFLGFFVVLSKAFGDVLGIIMCYSYAAGRISSPTEHPLYSLIPTVIAFAQSFEGVFSALGSVSFLYYLTDFEESTWNELRVKVFKKEGVRILIIICTHLCIVGLAIYASIDDNHISHVGYFLPPLAYGLELRTFLDLSYRGAQQIIQEYEGQMSKKSSPQIGNRTHHTLARASSYNRDRETLQPKFSDIDKEVAATTPTAIISPLPRTFARSPGLSHMPRSDSRSSNDSNSTRYY